MVLGVQSPQDGNFLAALLPLEMARLGQVVVWAVYEYRVGGADRINNDPDGVEWSGEWRWRDWVSGSTFFVFSFFMLGLFLCSRGIRGFI